MKTNDNRASHKQKVLLAGSDSMYMLDVELNHSEKFNLKSEESFPASFVVSCRATYPVTTQPCSY